MLKKTNLFLFFTAFCLSLSAQQNMTPETLLELYRVGGIGITADGKDVIYQTAQYHLEDNSRTVLYYSVPLKGGKSTPLKTIEGLVKDPHLSPDGEYRLVAKDVKIDKVTGTDFYDDVPKSDVKVYNSLNYRHWDHWEDGAFSHVFITPLRNRMAPTDIMRGEPYDCPQQPFGGGEDYIWNNDGTKVLYVSKKTSGTDYAISTNSDIYEYDVKTQKTRNLTAKNKGYDTHPSFSSKGKLAWLQMKRDGYESDKNDLVLDYNGTPVNITAGWDGTVNSFVWGADGRKIYFTAPVLGTVQLFEIQVPPSLMGATYKPKQITKGQFDVSGIVGQHKNTMVVSRRDMNHASELYTVDLTSGKMKQLTHANDMTYKNTNLSNIKKRMVKTTDGKEMLTWVIYPPNFDPKKKYPTLLYCQGGPQGALSQFYSFRWNFQMMAAKGYIVVAPNRRGMPGYGVEWNEQISGDYGGQNMQDYLAAIDDVAKEDYVDKDRLGCIGASYGGYSCFFLAGHHENRFKTFIAHDGIFNWQSMYGTTEEVFFPNWDLGGAYWDKNNTTAQKAYNEFNPINYVNNWNTPIMIIQGGKDYRVPTGQALEAFQAAQLKGIKSRLVYFPEENHWVLQPQNALIWQREFFKWLEETL